MIVIYIIEYVLFAYFLYVSLYALTLSTAGIFYRTPKAAPAKRFARMAVLIPSYKEDGVIVSVAQQALRQQYPANCFDVVVIADSLQSKTIERLTELPIIVLQVKFEKSTKVRALNKAFEMLPPEYDAAVILDADNVMEPHFLEKMNRLFLEGHLAVQGQRAPKNEDNSMSLLDGLSETINNYIYRQGNAALGLPSPLNGSGMFFHYQTLKEIMSGMDAIGGFDRELEYKLIERNVHVTYAKDIVVYDEKVEKPEVFENQRTRWISSQFWYLRKYFGRGVKALFRGKFRYFNSTVLRNIQLPRLINLGGLFIVTVLSFILQAWLQIPAIWWIALVVSNGLAIALAIPRRLYKPELLQSLALVPVLFFKMMKVMFRLKGANRTFIHTPHGRTKTETNTAA